MRINRQVWALAAIAAAGMMTAGCGGEGGEEAVFLYFINGYPGTSSMTVNSTLGTLATNVPFGERYGDDGTCPPDQPCLPARVERQLGTAFSILNENQNKPVDVDKDLYAMYPHETGTLVMTRRSGESNVNTTLLRHTQSISTDCTVTWVNGLSLDNQYTTVANYNIAPELYEEDLRYAGFSDEANTPFNSECGALPINDPTHQNLQRPNVLEAIAANPWFYLTECDQGADEGDAGHFGCKLGWGVPFADDRSRLGDGGSFVSVRDSDEYFECIEGAISIRAPEDSMVPVFPGVEVDCPPAPLTWADVDVDFQAVADCQDTIIKNTETLPPGSEDSTRGLQGYGVCDLRFRIRNEGQDIIFGPKGNDAEGKHQDGDLIESQVDIPAGSQRFWVLLGRPVNPLVWQWDSGDTFVDLTSFPYFNADGDADGLRPGIGDTDD